MQRVAKPRKTPIERSHKPSLIAAIKSQNNLIINNLLDSGIDPNTIDDTGQTPFSFACEFYEVQAINMISHPNFKLPENFAYEIYCAVQKGRYGLAQALLQRAQKEKRDNQLNTFHTDGNDLALEIALQQGNHRMVNLLLQHGAKPSPDHRIETYTPTRLKLFTFTNNTEIDQEREPPLHKAVRNEDFQQVNRLLAAGHNPHEANSMGKTAFSFACRFHELQAINMIHSPDFTLPENFARELYFAVERGQFALVENLLKRAEADGLDPQLNTMRLGMLQNTVLMLAEQNADVNMVNLLLEHGAKLNPDDNVQSQNPTFYKHALTQQLFFITVPQPSKQTNTMPSLTNPPKTSKPFSME